MENSQHHVSFLPKLWKIVTLRRLSFMTLINSMIELALEWLCPKLSNVFDKFVIVAQLIHSSFFYYFRKFQKCFNIDCETDSLNVCSVKLTVYLDQISSIRSIIQLLNETINMNLLTWCNHMGNWQLVPGTRICKSSEWIWLRIRKWYGPL